MSMRPGDLPEIPAFDFFLHSPSHHFFCIVFQDVELVSQFDAKNQRYFCTSTQIKEQEEKNLAPSPSKRNIGCFRSLTELRPQGKRKKGIPAEKNVRPPNFVCVQLERKPRGRFEALQAVPELRPDSTGPSEPTSQLQGMCHRRVRSLRIR